MCFCKCKDNCEVLLLPWFNVDFIIADAFTRPIDVSLYYFSISTWRWFQWGNQAASAQRNSKDGALSNFLTEDGANDQFPKKSLALQVSPQVVQCLTDECLNSLMSLFYSLSFLVFWIYWLLLLWLKINISRNQTIVPLKCWKRAGKRNATKTGCFTAQRLYSVQSLSNTLILYLLRVFQRHFMSC